jgi:gamma-glutamylcyclotransferase (GGCT)/AIG2-like uncharacterized protein YtfP
MRSLPSFPDIRHAGKMSSPSGSVSNLFCYGTLEFAEIMHAVAGRGYRRTGAVLMDHARYVMRGEVYPGVIAEAGARVNGTLYEGVDDHALQLLDYYESGDYRRRVLAVETGLRGLVDAWVYVVPAELRDRLGEQDWDPAAFARYHLSSWLGKLPR